MARTCGGCQGLGAHRRWCPAVVGVYASRVGDAAAVVEDIGDHIGPNDMALSNQCWALAARLREYASSQAQVWRDRNE